MKSAMFKRQRKIPCNSTLFQSGVRGVLIAAVFSVPLFTCAINVYSQTPKDVPAIDQAIQSYMQLTGATAATVAINMDRKLVYSNGYGFADSKQRVPTRSISTMRIASCTKPFTRIAVQKLIDQGKLSPETKIFELLRIPPAKNELVDARIRQVTVSHLMNHTGGWDRFSTFDPMYELEMVKRGLKINAQPSQRQIVEFMWTKPLQQDPGTKKFYSNFGYMLLGLALEKTTGESYIQSIRRIIGQPLGIDDLSISSKRRRSRHPREVYYANETNLNLQLLDSASGLACSAASLCKFMSEYWLDGVHRDVKRNRYFYQIGTHPFTTTTIMEQRLDGIDFALMLNARRNESFDEDNNRIRAQFNTVLDQARTELGK